jgi:hypothetical protein
MATLSGRIVALSACLQSGGVPHAFGGALALAYHVAEPRATRDLNVNVFVSPFEAAYVLRHVPDGVVWGPHDVDRIERDGQRRFLWDDTPLDLFFSTHRFHAMVQERVELVPFDAVPIVGAVDLAVFKAYFDRTRDWADIEAMIEAGALDVHAALGWLADLVGPADPRVARMRCLARGEQPPSTDLRFAPAGG